MEIEIGAPASLPLAVVRFESGATGLLGATLQHPPTNLFARAAAGLTVTGARADVAAGRAQRFFQHHGLPAQAEIDIELAIPSQMGLGSEGSLALSTGQALAWAHGLPMAPVPVLAEAVGLPPEHALEIQGYQGGGVLLVNTGRPDASAPAMLRRQSVAHREEHAWVFVLVLPRVAAGTPETLEAERLAALLASAEHLGPQSGHVLDADLWPALAAGDLEGFARALRTMQALNETALRQAGAEAPLTDEEQAVLDVCRENGALAWGRSPTGLALFALIRGATPSIQLRKRLAEHVGPFGGIVLASVVDNEGARHRVHATRPIYTGVSPLVSGSHNAR